MIVILNIIYLLIINPAPILRSTNPPTNPHPVPIPLALLPHHPSQPVHQHHQNESPDRSNITEGRSPSYDSVHRTHPQRITCFSHQLPMFIDRYATAINNSTLRCLSLNGTTLTHISNAMQNRGKPWLPAVLTSPMADYRKSYLWRCRG